MTTDTLIQKVVEFTTPTICLLCATEPKLVCGDCYPRALVPLPPQTPMAVTGYDDVGKELIRRFKFEGDKEAGRLCARYMAEMVDADDYDAVVAVTTTTGATLASAGQTLLEAGAKSVESLVFAQDELAGGPSPTSSLEQRA